MQFTVLMLRIVLLRILVVEPITIRVRRHRCIYCLSLNATAVIDRSGEIPFNAHGLWCRGP